MNIFYNKNGLQDTLIISVENIEHDLLIEEKDYVVLKNENNVVGINIFHFSKYLDIKSGYIYPTNEIITIVKKITNIDIKPFVQINFQVGKIASFEKIPNTKLSNCKINIGEETLQIVCGANNFETNNLVVVAKINSMLPNGFHIHKSKIQGFESFGMLCSKKEMLLKDFDGNDVGILLLNNKKYKLEDEFVEIYNNLI
ncbi:MAG: DUF4479 domain-containing protein [Malacoplasma sp.]